jgi:hypothetical protein
MVALPFPITCECALVAKSNDPANVKRISIPRITTIFLYLFLFFSELPEFRRLKETTHAASARFKRFRRHKILQSTMQKAARLS